ncbi:hypothetical protein FACS1894191_6480 [Clostridia bacterium]|nr:hypothetical protein FACS1894191_6480 [Clostridia bacterium]
MLSSFAERITERFIQNGVIASEDREIYQYGFEMGISQIINIISTVLIGFLFQMPLESITFLLSFMTLRTYTGGYHSSSHLKCYALSVSVTAILLGLCRLLIIWEAAYTVSAAVGLIGICLLVCLAPVEDKNKPMDAVEQIVFRGRAMRNLAIWCIVTVIMVFTPLWRVALTLCLSLFAMGITAACGQMKNYALHKRTQ